MLFTQKNQKLIKLFLLVLLFGCKVNGDYVKSINEEREKLNKEFSDKSTSPLDSLEIKAFKGLDFYPIDPKYKVKAEIELIANSDIFELAHSNNRSRPYKNYGTIRFELKGKKVELLVLESAKKKEGYEDHLLLCFTDNSNGKGSYDGGRYLDLKKSLGNSLEIDFNLAYNPYCAVSSRYTCPIPPAQNHIDMHVKAGMKYAIKH